jgi:tRNA(Ile)-lysidine synthase
MPTTRSRRVLLALSRGAGLPGLAAMPARLGASQGVAYHRPLLGGACGGAIRALARRPRRGMSKTRPTTDTALTRNRIRAHLLPVLEQAFPGFRETFARSARHAAQAQQVLDDVAREDHARVAAGTDLLIADLRVLSRPRQANLLRHWLRTVHQVVAQAAQLEELLDQILACSTRGHRIHIKVGPGFARRQGQTLTWYNPGRRSSLDRVSATMQPEAGGCR